MIRLLLIEFIHADETAYVDVPAGLRVEGRGMLDALVSDAVEAKDVVPIVLLCEAATADGCRFAPDVNVLVPDVRCPLMDQLEVLSDHFDAVLPIVPECDQLLPSVARVLAGTESNILLPPTEFIEICSDKLVTWNVLGAAGIPMLESAEVDSSTAFTDEWVFKDRWGAGCEGIQRGQPTDRNSSGVIRQRWIEAVSVSVGILGNGDQTLALPVARQKIQWKNGRPEYLGGDIPAAVDPFAAQQVERIAQQVREFAGHFVGYIGIDFLIETNTRKVFLNEVNPRVCTSYIGYRSVLTANAIELMLGVTPLSIATVRPLNVSFDKSGATMVAPT